MKFYGLIMLAIIFFLGCKKDDDLLCIQPCLLETIGNVSDSNCYGIARITKYLFQDSIVYHIDPGYCYSDQDYEIINSHCESLGYLGGFAGIETIKGLHFFDNARLLGIVWEEE